MFSIERGCLECDQCGMPEPATNIRAGRTCRLDGQYLVVSEESRVGFSGRWTALTYGELGWRHNGNPDDIAKILCRRCGDIFEKQKAWNRRYEKSTGAGQYPAASS